MAAGFLPPVLPALWPYGIPAVLLALAAVACVRRESLLRGRLNETAMVFGGYRRCFKRRTPLKHFRRIESFSDAAQIRP